MFWTVKRLDVRCGRCGVTIPADEPVAVLAGGLVRCVFDAAMLGFEINHTEIELERYRLEEDLRRISASRLREADARPQLPPRPVQRVTPHRKPQPAARVADLLVHDHGLAAAGDRD